MGGHMLKRMPCHMPKHTACTVERIFTRPIAVVFCQVVVGHFGSVF